MDTARAAPRKEPRQRTAHGVGKLGGVFGSLACLQFHSGCPGFLASLLRDLLGVFERPASRLHLRFRQACLFSSSLGDLFCLRGFGCEVSNLLSGSHNLILGLGFHDDANQTDA